MFTRRFASALAFLLGAGVVAAAETPDRSPAVPDKIFINAQSLDYKNKDNKAIFTGKVVLTKGVFIMHADQMIIYFEGATAAFSSKEEGKALPSRPASADLPTFGNRAVSLIDATGNVRMQQGEKRAKSKRAVYHQREEKLVLTGDPEAWEEGYRVTGSQMTMFLKEDRSIVEGSRVVINDAESKPR